ncbi:unnamed protein product [Orchesella dallaii]|uniref:C2H2-type domain-containing protein n=1 Tax=Orchesella dallaii TaxID=48710 RepID=A0ABP1RQP9_9HEXA
MHLSKKILKIEGGTRILHGKRNNHLKTGLKEQMGKRSRECDQCLKLFSSADALKRHLIVHTDERPFHCDKCSWTFKRRDLLARHIIRRHSQQQLEGDNTDPSIRIQSTCEGTIDSAGAGGDVPKGKSKRHRRLAVKCLCCKPTSTTTQHEHHQDNHPKSQTQKSEESAGTPKSQSKVGIHNCSQCGKGYSTKANLKRHFAIHTMLVKEETVDNNTSKEELNNTVSVSNAALSTSSSKRLDGGLYKCPDCGYGFTFKANMMRHYRVQHGKALETGGNQCGGDSHLSRKLKSSATGAAGLSLTTKRSEKSHPIRKKIRKSTRVKANECPECGKVFSSSKNAKRHMIVHMDERPFACEFCTGTFKRKDALASHLQSIHRMGNEVSVETSRVKVAPAKEFAFAAGNVKVLPNRVSKKKKTGSGLNNCPQCGLVLSSRRNLKIHFATHNDVRPFACRLCFWRFKRKDNLFKHLKCKHFKSEKAARKMVYSTFAKYGYNMRERGKRPASPVKVPVPVPPRRKYVPIPKPKPLVVKREVIVIVGDLKFCTPGLMLEPPKRTIQGCATYEEWFWEDYFKAVEDLILLAPLTKEEPEFDMTLAEYANLCCD